MITLKSLINHQNDEDIDICRVVDKGYSTESVKLKIRKFALFRNTFQDGEYIYTIYYVVSGYFETSDSISHVINKIQKNVVFNFTQNTILFDSHLDNGELFSEKIKLFFDIN